MTKPHRTIVAVALGAALAGCVSLFPKTPPDQLYSVGRLPPPEPGTATQVDRPDVGVVLSAVELRRAAIGDGILTQNGVETAYLAGARWTTPAPVMLQEDAERGFEVRARVAHLLHRGEIGSAAALLRLDFGDFEARYDQPGAAAIVVVSVTADLEPVNGHGVRSQTFTVREPAADNRIGPIVAAFDKATAEALAQVVDWTDANAAAVAAEAPEPPSRTTTTTSSSSTTTTTAPPGAPR